jgi:LysM repeat protein
MSYESINLRYNMKRWFWLLALASTFNDALAQEPLYINVDPLCMDRYEYHINGELKGIEFISYRVRQSAKDNVFLEIGSESSSMQLSMPESKDCRNVRFSPDYVEKINTGEVQVFVVRKADIGYNISQVTAAAYHYVDGNTLKYKAYGMDFFSNLSHSAPGVNLAQADSNGEMYFSGEASDGCVKEYHFRKIPKQMGRPNIDIDFVPEIGVIRELTRVSDMNDHESMLNLVRINDISLDSYMSKLCSGKSSTVYMPTTYAVETTDLSSLPVSEIVIDGITYGADGLQISSDNNSSMSNSYTTTSYSDMASIDGSIPSEYNMTNVSLTEKGASSEVKVIKPKVTKKVETIKAAAGTHIVAAGETLYGIARQNSLTVEQLKLWNNLTTDNLALGATLKTVAPPSTSLTPKALPSIKKGTATAAPKAYEETSVKFTSKGGDVKVAEKEMHYTVAPGETISGLATKFGYTEQRFRTMNNLTTSDLLKVGQVLKVTDCVCPIPQNYSPTIGRINLSKKEEFTERGIASTTGKKEEKKKEEAPKAIYKRMTVHIVTEDETIEAIAAKYNVSVTDLMTINGFEPRDILIPNQRVFVD